MTKQEADSLYALRFIKFRMNVILLAYAPEDWGEIDYNAELRGCKAFCM